MPSTGVWENMNLSLVSRRDPVEELGTVSVGWIEPCILSSVIIQKNVPDLIWQQLSLSATTLVQS